MRVNRRAESNHALAFAVEMANRLDLPVLCYDHLLADYPYASDRFHTFLFDGVPETKKRLERLGIGYEFYLRNQLPKAAANAAAIVTDDWPLFHNGPSPADVACYAVDSSCIVPMSRMEKREFGAYTIRPKIHRLLPEYLQPVPPLKVKRKYQETSAGRSRTWTRRPAKSTTVWLRRRPFAAAAKKPKRRLQLFLEQNLRRYARDKNEPSAHATSGLSPYLHFGYLSSLEVALAVRDYAREHNWIADEFLEELIVRRELAFNFARFARARRFARRAAGLGPRDACASTRATAATRSTRASSSNRPALTTRSGTPPSRRCCSRQDPRLLPHVLGQEDHRVVGHARRSARHHDPYPRPLRARRPRSQHLRQYPLVLRAARPSVRRAARSSARSATCRWPACGARPMWTPTSARLIP